MTDFAAEIKMLREQEQTLKSRREFLEGRLTEKLKEQATAAFAAANKDSGTLSFTVNGVKYRAEIRKTVKWDSDKLQGTAAGMPWSVVERLFDISFSVPESRFNAIHDEELLAKLMQARTTKHAPLKIVPE